MSEGTVFEFSFVELVRLRRDLVIQLLNLDKLPIDMVSTEAESLVRYILEPAIGDEPVDAGLPDGLAKFDN